ncbi:MAG: hypothetical protein ACM37U_07660 [Gemmatimonas sp.]|nr:hypothetical protein [Gemmatimonadaceae bacterium]
MISRFRAAAFVAAFVGCPSASIAQRATIVGRVVVLGTDVPLGYSVIGFAPDGREAFSDADGRFALRDVKAGRVRIWAKHIGQTPLDTTLDVAAGDSITLRLELPLVSIQLPAIHTLAKECAHLGESSPKLGAALATLFEQLKQNAERNRLLSQSYPFEVEIERKITKPEPALEARFVAFDTIRRTSQRNWQYAPGRLLGTREYTGGIFGGTWTTVAIPELSDFADETFLNFHCFDYSGVEVVNGDTLLRVDFIPAPSVHDPDVGGALFVDPKSYQIRSTFISLVNLTKKLREQIGGQSIRATFKEVVPGVPILDVVSSMVYPRDDPKAPTQEPATEMQRALSVRFLKGKP